MSRKSGGVLAFLILCWISAMYFPQPDAQASNIVQSTTPAGLTPGNSGGIPFYLTTTTFGSSPTWTLNTLLTGGGAGLSPAVTGVTIDGSNNMAGVTSITVGTQILVNNSTLINSGGVLIQPASSFQWQGQSSFTSPSDGVVLVKNSAGTSFNRVQLGGTTASFPSLKRNGTAIEARLADDSQAGPIIDSGTISAGVKFTTSGCAVSATTGGATAGTFTSGTSGTCTVVLTMGGLTATNGWACQANDRTTFATFANDFQQTASTQTTATVSATTVSGDIVSFFCIGY